MKKVLSLIMVFGILLGLTACGKDKGRILYNLNLEKYIKLEEYKNIKIDTKSDEYQKMYQAVIDFDIEDNGFYVKKTEGKVEEGDTANIDYVGKKNGVAFDGGTASGYDLKIGSNSFIDGFEDGLIGKEIGSTVDLNLTFPKNYGNDELKGAAVVFTVKINHVTTEKKITPEEFYKDLGYKTVEEYYAHVKENSVKELIADMIIEKAVVKKYPKADNKLIIDAIYNSNEKYYQANYGATMEQYLQSVNQTKEEYQKELDEQQVKPLMKQQMAFYLILDNEGMSVTQKEIDDKVKETVANVNNSSVDAKYVKEYFGEYYFENTIVNEKVLDFLYKSAKIS